MAKLARPYRYFKLKKFYKQRFEEILAEEPKHIHKIEDKIKARIQISFLCRTFRFHSYLD